MIVVTIFLSGCSGRKITSRGQKDLDQIAGQVYFLMSSLESVQVAGKMEFADFVPSWSISGMGPHFTPHFINPTKYLWGGGGEEVI